MAEKRSLDDNAISILDEVRSRYGRELGDSDAIRILWAARKDLDDLVRDRAKKLTLR